MKKTSTPRDIPGGGKESARRWKYRWRSCRRCCSSIHTFTIAVSDVFLRGNVLFFVVYFAILVLFMTIYGSFSVRKYRTRELVFAFGLSSFFTDTIAYFPHVHDRKNVSCRRSTSSSRCCCSASWRQEFLFSPAFWLTGSSRRRRRC